jgi:pyrimidine operon attenuation protein / uracil phosphoribosyltransferase
MMPAVDIAGASVVPKWAVSESELIEKRELLDSAGIVRALKRIAHEIAERNAAAGDVVLVGIRTAGVPLAERLAGFVRATGELKAATGAIDITLYRDDVFEGLPKPEVGTTTLPEHTIAGKTVILVDDVLYTGRTIRAALDALMDYGRPRAVQLAVLVDRGHRELPIQPDYVGLKVETTRTQSVKVILDGPKNERDRAVLREKR